ncbi:hypothetical protein RHGRI_009698 [Rhododendron griersonianum]|uniref:Uncharacterized protein n=1 Tax=Rhododendron griersonianum TaxID=479676 RepID=A0AAV6KFU1_9ERIC|nr:hypothetical protein RHGRI_009698 [Rhododendron griersonianum]
MVSDRMNALSAAFFARFATPKLSGLVSYPPGIVNAAAKVTVAISVATKAMVLMIGLKSSTRSPTGTLYSIGSRPRGALRIVR